MIFSFFYQNKKKSTPCIQIKPVQLIEQNITAPSIRSRKLAEKKIEFVNRKGDETDEEDNSQKIIRDTFMQIGTSETSKILNHRKWLMNRRKKITKQISFANFDHLDEISEDQAALQFQNFRISHKQR